MDDKIYFLAQNINFELNNDPRIIKLNKLEKELNDSFEVFNLSNKKDEALDKYTRFKDLYSPDSEESKNALLELKEAKEQLNEHPLVKEYLAQYSLVRDLYMEIDNILFSDYRKERC